MFAVLLAKDAGFLYARANKISLSRRRILVAYGNEISRAGFLNTFCPPKKCKDKCKGWSGERSLRA
jgi:hypothetical protein